MKNALLIAEKPSLMKEIQAAYQNLGYPDQITFRTFAGHTMGLQEPGDYRSDWGAPWTLTVLPMIPDTFIYKPTPDKLKMYQQLRDEVLHGQWDYIINACDPGREGQHIFWSFYDSLGVKIPVKRIWHRDLTEQELHRALNHLIDENDPSLKNMTIASKYRAYFDWLIGMNGTRAITISTRKKVPVGRVMTPVLKLVVAREKEIQHFVSKDFWEIEADYDAYKGTYFDHNNEDETKFFDKAKADAIIKQLGKTGTVLSINKKTEIKYAPNLHSLQELSNEANRVYGYTMSETLAIAQTLYEKKILSYPRTDSSFVTKAIAAGFPKLLKAIHSVPGMDRFITSILGDTTRITNTANNKKYVDDSKVSDHYALVPTGVTVQFGALSQKEQNIFLLVAKRFISIFLDPLKTENTTMITENNGSRFRTKGVVVLDPGFTVLYNTPNSNVLPVIKKGQTFPLKGTKLVAKKTTPPQRYTDETLGKAMANAGRFVDDDELASVLKDADGLGTPATRGPIVDKIVGLQMMERKGSGKVKAFYATDFGISVIDALDGKEITLPELTAKWEQKLTGIEAGTYSPAQFYQEMLDEAKKMITELSNSSMQVVSTAESVGKCPKCGADVVDGKNYYRCQKYKNGCDFILGKEISGAKLSKLEVQKLLAGKPTKIMAFTWKSGNKGNAQLKLVNGDLKFVFDAKGGKK
jgi:DNA topoisomerase-3